jgi:DNA (cytosine-5)-methyltransferase 1
LFKFLCWKTMNELALFSGAGGGILASELLGWRTVCAVEIDDYARGVLLARQNDGILRPFPIWDDITTFDARPWRGIVDVVSGGFPCVDISVARAMWGREGIAGERSGLWFEYLRIIDECQPRYVWGENSPELKAQGLADIVRALSERGYVCQWATIGADDCGLPHKRNAYGFSLPTPTSRDWKDTPGMKMERKDGKTRADRLPMLLFLSVNSAGIQWKQTTATDAQTVKVKGLEVRIAGREYCPELPEWLMGWPIGWTDYAPLETGKFLSWRQRHGDF